MMSFPTWCVAILLLTAAVSQAVQWSPSPPDETIVQTCVGDDVTLPWNFTLEPGENVEEIKWHYADDKSSQLIAMAENTFIVMPSFSGRVSHLGNAGLALSHVVKSDGENYSVQINVNHGNAGVLLTSDRTVILQVAKAPAVTEAGSLTVSQTRTAVYNNLTHTWHVQLTCGTFTDLGQPPVDVVWQTPSGSSLPSTSTEGGNFYFMLDNPPLGGDYSCRVASHSPATACLHGNNSMLMNATVTVDEVKARLTLIEAHQGSSERELQQQRAEFQNQTTELQQQKAELEQQKVENADLKQKNTELTNQLVNLTHYVNSLEEELNVYQNTTSQRVSFHARLSPDKHLSDANITLDHVFTNDGGAYSPTTGVFTVPVNGTYVLFAAVGTHSTEKHAAAYLMADNDGICNTWSQHYREYQSSSCQAVVHLVKGQEVWIQADGECYYYNSLTYFSGFLVHADE